MSINFIPLGNAIDLVTSAVTDSITGNAITDAVLTAVLKTEGGVTLATSSALTHEGGGIYKGPFDISAVSLTLNTHYYLALAASNYAVQWKRLYRAEDRPLVGSGSVSIDLTPGTSGLPSISGIPLGDGSGIYATATPGSDYAVPVGSRRLKCDKAESISADGTYKTLVNVSDGPAVVTNLWFAFSAASASLLTDKVRITFDGASPQITCVIGDFCGTGGTDAVRFRHSLAGGALALDTPPTTATLSGFIKLPMPYSTSLKVECNLASGSMFCMAERYAFTSDSSFKAYGFPNKTMRLYTTGDGSTSTPAGGAASTFLNTNVPTILAGIVHSMSNTITPGYLEGNYKIYYAGSGTASFESSGTEDFYHSSFYFQEGPFGDDDEACVFNNASINGTTSRTMVNRFFPLDRAPYDPSGVKLTWNNGDIDPGGVTTTRWLVWYYK